MGKLDDAIAQTACTLDNLKLLRDILNSGDCNICKKKKECDYCPKPGQMVRYNCPFYEYYEKINVGDYVTITSGMYVGLKGVVKTIEPVNNDRPTYIVDCGLYGVISVSEDKMMLMKGEKI